MSRQLTINVQETDVREIVEQAINTMKPIAEEKGLHLSSHITKHAVIVDGDPTRLQQILTNLLSNAVKFTPQNGNVSINLERTTDSIQITVKDTGIGIEPEFLPRVFDPFVQADSTNTRVYSGLGLGLAIVRRLAELHNGNISVEGAGRGQGTTFTLSLPAKSRKNKAS